MPETSPSTFLRVADALKALRGFAFEEVCNDYLKARYPALTPRRSLTAEWTVSGSPDAYAFEPDGALIACQHASGDGWRTKLLGKGSDIGDAAKVAEVSANAGLNVRKLMFCTNVVVELNDQAEAARQVADRYGFSLEICDLRRLADDLTTLYPGIAARRLGLSHPLRHVISLDEYLRSPSERYWPKEDDLQQEKVYFPPDYLEALGELAEKRLCLLSGLSGSGKTTLAIAFMMRWRAHEPGRLSHPEAVGYYLDPAPGGDEAAGERWYEELRAIDRQNELVVIDNCHLAPRATAAFLEHVRRSPPTHLSIICIATAPRSDEPWDQDSDPYARWFDDRNAVLEVTSEALFEGVVRTYSASYSRSGLPVVPVATDLADPLSRARLEQICGHNLAAAKTVLDAWAEAGGRLSEVSSEVALDGLSRRHLTRHKAAVLGNIAALAQFEVGVHESYVERFDDVGFQELISNRLVYPEQSNVWGLCYRLAAHPEVGKQLFQAWLRQRFGARNRNVLETELLTTLAEYIGSAPNNVLELLRNLGRTRRDLRTALLRRAPLQEAVLVVVRRREIKELMIFLSMLATADRARARELFAHEVDRHGLDKMKLELDTLGANAVYGVMNAARRIDEQLAKELFADRAPEWFAERLRGASARTVKNVLNDLKRLGRTTDDLASIIDGLDLKELAADATTFNLINLKMLLRDLRSSPEGLRIFSSNLDIADLAARISEEKSIKEVVEFEYFLPRPQSQRLTSSWDSKTLARIVERSSLAEIGAALEVAPKRVKPLYETFVKDGLEMRVADSTYSEIGRLLTRLKRVPTDGERFAADAASRVVRAARLPHLTGDELEAFAVLLWTLNEVAPDEIPRLLGRVDSRDLKAAVGGSGVRGIQLLVRNLGTLAPDHLPVVALALEDADIAPILSRAEPGELTFLIWNVWNYIGADAGQRIVGQIDRNLDVSLVIDASADDLSRLFWNMVQCGGASESRLFASIALHERMRNEWDEAAERWLSVVGEFAIGAPESEWRNRLALRLSPAVKTRIRKRLVETVELPSPQIFGLLVSGMRELYEQDEFNTETATLFRDSDEQTAWLGVLADAATMAETPRAKEMLVRISSWL